MFRAVAVLLSAFTGFVPASNPPHSIQPTAAFARACYGRTRPTLSCDKKAIANINRARALESVGTISLPVDYASLTLDQQMVAVSNAERTSRGLSALPEVKADDNLAKAGAVAQTDPTGPAGHAWGSIWAGVADPLAADFLWMYDDGPGGVNGDCPTPDAPGCWGHRDNILGAAWTTMGAGHDHASLAELFVQ
jgi:hypothetical protein